MKKREWKKDKVLNLLPSRYPQTINLAVVYADPCIFHLWRELGVCFHIYREYLTLCILGAFCPVHKVNGNPRTVLSSVVSSWMNKGGLNSLLA